MQIPDFITHYHYPDRKPFQNIMDLSEEERVPVVTELNKRYQRAECQREFPEWYFEQRRKAEERLRQVLISKGGKPERTSPHYFVLGRSPRLEQIYNYNFGSISFRLPPGYDNIYFSLGDSLWTFTDPVEVEKHWENQWFQGVLYTYNEVCEVLRELRIDLEDQSALERHNIGFVEAQIWSDSDLEKLVEYNNQIRLNGNAA